MASKQFNTTTGYSVGENTIISVVDANANVTPSNLTVSGLSQLGVVGNVKIGGGDSGQILSTDGAGNLAWVNSASGGSGSLTVYARSGSISVQTISGYLTIYGRTSNVVVVVM